MKPGGVHLLDLIEQGYGPETTIIDNAKGLIKGFEEVLPKTVIRHDHFHIIMDIKDCGKFLSNEEASAVNTALIELNRLEETRKIFKLLSQWLQYDVLQLAGLPPGARTELYDFIVTEMEALALKHPHRIDAIVSSLKYQQEALLDVSHALNKQFAAIARQYLVPIETIWAICYAARYELDSIKGHEASCELESLLGLQYEEIEDAVLDILETTHRCSSMIENFNSRLIS